MTSRVITIFLVSPLIVFNINPINAWVFDRSEEGLTSLLNETIPINTTEAIFEKNAISFVPSNYFINLPGLIYIDLNKNVVEDLADYSFINVSGLEELRLNYNKIKVIRRYMMAGLYNLRKLYLSQNSICSIEIGSFYDLQSLEQLKIKNNELQTIRRAVFHPENHPSSLNYVAVGNNPWQCNKRLCWIHEGEIKM